MSNAVCYKCGCLNGSGERELRPYGSKGEMVCFECGQKDEETTLRSFIKQLDEVAKKSPIVLLGPEGPVPVGRRDKFD